MRYPAQAPKRRGPPAPRAAETMGQTSGKLYDATTQKTWMGIQRAYTEVTMAKVDFSQPTGNESDEDDDEKEEEAGGQRRTDFPGQHEQRKIPGEYSTDNTDRLSNDDRQRVVANGCRLVVELVDQFGVPLDGVNRLGNVYRLTVSDRFAAVEAFHDREFSPVSCHQFAQTDQHVFAFCGM